MASTVGKDATTESFEAIARSWIKNSKPDLMQLEVARVRLLDKMVGLDNAQRKDINQAIYAIEIERVRLCKEIASN